MKSLVAKIQNDVKNEDIPVTTIQTGIPTMTGLIRHRSRKKCRHTTAVATGAANAKTTANTSPVDRPRM
jgi:hypothetical protein